MTNQSSSPMTQNKPAIEIKYQDTICCFLDILGFSNLVRAQDQKISEYYNFISGYVSSFKEMSDLKLMAISDSIIITAPYNLNDWDRTLSSFRVMLDYVSVFQYKLANMGLWTRGGIARGNLSFDLDRDIIVGDAFIRAMDLEKMAIFPRVIIDTQLVKDFNFLSVRHMITTLNKHTSPLITWGNLGDVIYDYKKYDWGTAKNFCVDRPMFIDYGTGFEHYDHPTNWPTCFSHLMSDMSGKVEHFEKYQWLCSYLSMRARFANIKKRNSDALQEAASFMDSYC